MMEVLGISETVVLRYLPCVQEFCSTNNITAQSNDEPPPLGNDVKLQEVKGFPEKMYNKKLGNAALAYVGRFMCGESLTQISAAGYTGKPVRVGTIVENIATVAYSQPLKTGLAKRLLDTLPQPWSSEWESQFYDVLKKMSSSEINLLGEIRKTFMTRIKTEVDWDDIKAYRFKFFYLRAKGELHQYEIQRSNLKRKSRTSSEAPSPKRMKPNPTASAPTPIVQKKPNLTTPPVFQKPSATIKKSTPSFRKKKPLFSAKKTPTFSAKKKPSFGGKSKTTPKFGSKEKPKSTSPFEKKTSFPKFGKKRKSTPVFGKKAKQSPRSAKKSPIFGKSTS